MRMEAASRSTEIGLKRYSVLKEDAARLVSVVLELVRTTNVEAEVV